MIERATDEQLTRRRLPRGPVLTTQLFFPGVAANRSDGIYTRECLVEGWRLENGRRHARFDFVLEI